MGINWGLALGQAAKSGLDTFTTLQEEQRKAEEAERRKQEFEWKAQEQRDTQAVKDLNAQTLGNVGNQDYTQAIQTESGTNSQQAKMLADDIRGMGADAEKESALSTTNTMRRVAGKEAIAPEALKGTTYTEKQALADFKSGLAKAKIDPLKAAQITSALRTEQRANEEDAFHERMQERYKQIKEDPVKFVEDNISIYNDAKTGLFGDGNTAKLIKAEDGSASLEVRNAKGKIVTVQPINQETAIKGLQLISAHEYGMMTGKFKEAAELGLKRDEVAIKADTAKTEKEFKGEGGVYHKVHMAAIDAQKGKSPTALYNEKVNATAQALLDSGDAKTLAEARVKAAKMVLHAPAEIKGDANGNYVVGNKLYVPDPKNPGRFMEAQGFGPNSVVQAFANYDPNKAPKATPTSALPVQSAGVKQMDAVAIKNGWKPMGAGGDMYFKLDANGEPIHRTGAALAKELGVLY